MKSVTYKCSAKFVLPESTCVDAVVEGQHILKASTSKIR